MDTALAVVLAAEQLLVENGYAACSTNAIARRAGVSIGSLYQYFNDKEAVFRALVRRHRDEMNPMILAALEAMADPRTDMVKLTLDLMRRLAEANARNPRLMAAIESELGWLEHEPDEVHHQLLAQVCTILRQRSNLPPDELQVTALLTFVTVEHLSRWLVHGRPPGLDTERFIAATGRMLSALLPRPTSSGLRATVSPVPKGSSRTLRAATSRSKRFSTSGDQRG
jgi:AcrR family transcriptional regulator